MIRIVNTEACSGCYACANICPEKCIVMKSDHEGFWYPEVDERKCIRCGRCVQVCSNRNQVTASNIPQAFACRNKDEKVRKESSSGGIFTLMAENVIEKGGVVFGACFSETLEVNHRYVECKEELTMLRGSKYVQSKIGESYIQARKFLLMDRKVLYSGTPCQIAGLRAFLGRDFTNLICVDLVCHGVPSPKVWKKYIEHRERIAGSSTQKMSFRNKEDGWKSYSVSFEFENDKTYKKMFNRDPYMRAFLQNISLRPSCYSCAFKSLKRQSDLTLADFWGIESIAPEMNDDKGISLVLVQTRKGKKIFGEVEQELVCAETDCIEAVRYNSAAIESVKKNRNRNNFFKELESRTFDTLVEQYCRSSAISRIKRAMIQILRNRN